MLILVGYLLIIVDKFGFNPFIKFESPPLEPHSFKEIIQLHLIEVHYRRAYKSCYLISENLNSRFIKRKWEIEDYGPLRYFPDNLGGPSHRKPY